MDTVRHGSKYGERSYFRMFNCDGTQFQTDALADLTSAQKKKFVINNNRMPAGFTYFGQFVDHDITKLKRGSEIPGEGPIPEDELVQERTPSLDLDSLYGDGLTDNVVQYRNGQFHSDSKIGSDDDFTILDLPRNDKKIAQIADGRNDENLIVARLHVLFMNLHNKLFRRRREASIEARFEATRQEVTLIYQSIILNDFLPRILHPKVHVLLVPQPGFQPWTDVVRGSAPRVPIEFAVAAYRFGHALVRNSYKIGTDLTTFTLHDLFRNTGKGGLDGHPSTAHINLDWSLFFEVSPDTSPQKSLSITTRPTPALADMINEKAGNKDLTDRNLKRGSELALPCAQDCIEQVKKDRPDLYGHFLMPAIDPASGHVLADELKRWGMEKKTPLWTYILMEPAYLERPYGHRVLGNLGSFIVAETFRSLFMTSRISHFFREEIDQPFEFFKNQHTMAEVISFVQSH